MDRSPSAFMKSFFAEVPDLDELAPDALATEYVKYCYSRLDELPSLVAPAHRPTIPMDGKSFSFATTRSMLYNFESPIGITQALCRERLCWPDNMKDT